ncbi:hypothetical protein IQ07DRAFT_583757 [Pyrenochaeta sp. DS3sAY3a]|nr:hypothetical protein IQ07DRAFT_583757 [Pyrenochaeta sp. DS3sAY3a]
MAIYTLPLLGLVLYLLCSTILAAPSIKLPYRAVQPQKRNTRDNPTPVTADISGWPDIAEFDCWKMLCHEGGNRVYQKVLT